MSVGLPRLWSKLQYQSRFVPFNSSQSSCARVLERLFHLPGSHGTSGSVGSKGEKRHIELSINLNHLGATVQVTHDLSQIVFLHLFDVQSLHHSVQKVLLQPRQYPLFSFPLHLLRHIHVIITPPQTILQLQLQQLPHPLLSLSVCQPISQWDVVSVNLLLLHNSLSSFGPQSVQGHRWVRRGLFLSPDQLQGCHLGIRVHVVLICPISPISRHG